jgi:hypothetical protein
MVSQRWRRDTEVPPNLSTIQGWEVGMEGMALGMTRESGMNAQF